MSKTALAIITSLFIFQANAQSRFALNGTIKDDKGATLPGATVFLSNTKSMTSTDANGAFQLKDITPGTYILVAKFIGYQTLSTAVNVVDRSVAVNLTLKDDAHQLSQVTITDDPKWEEHYEEFKKRFLGVAPNAKKCQIENKKALHFRYSSKKEMLTASADEFLKIRNDALGYQVNYLLESFEYNLKTGIIKYQGYPSFEELKPADEKQAGLWAKNRAAAYAGSPTHFMKALFDENSYKQGFRIYSCNYDAANPYTDEGQDKPIQVFTKDQVFLDSLISKTDNDFKMLSFKKSLFVVYIKGRETFDYKNSGYAFQRPLGISMIPPGQLSIISLLDNNVSLDSKGNFSAPDALLFRGYMAWRQVADLTPLEYSLSPAGQDE